ncbi:MAG: ATP-binding protein, partial [Pseudoflavonifractor sp.]
MKDLSLHVLDIAQNSVTAGAKHLDISLADRAGLRTLVITDDGRGMAPDFLAAVTDPFTTTRSTRKVGLGLPLLRMAAEQTGG